MWLTYVLRLSQAYPSMENLKVKKGMTSKPSNPSGDGLWQDIRLSLLSSPLVVDGHKAMGSVLECTLDQGHPGTAFGHGLDTTDKRPGFPGLSALFTGRANGI